MLQVEDLFISTPLRSGLDDLLRIRRFREKEPLICHFFIDVAPIKSVLASCSRKLIKSDTKFARPYLRESGMFWTVLRHLLN